MAKTKSKESKTPITSCMERVKKHYKRPILKRAGDASNAFMIRRPTGITNLDIAIGGGFPAGGMSQIAAPSGVGKNSLCNSIIAECQKRYGHDSCIAWVWTEVPFDKSHARINGAIIPSSDYEINLEQQSRARNNLPKLTKKQIEKRKRTVGEFIIADEGSSAEKLQAAVELVRENICQVIVIDSIAAVVSNERDKTDLDDEPQQSAEARLITEFQKKMWHALGNPYNDQLNKTTIIAINQVRANRSRRSIYEKEWKVGGAYAIRHGKLIDVVLQPGSKVYFTPTGKETTKKDKNYKIVGKQVKWAIEKGKAGCHEGPQGEAIYYYDYGFNKNRDLIVAALRYGTVKIVSSAKNNESKYFVLGLGGQEVESGEGGVVELEEKLRAEPVFFDIIYDLTIRASGIRCVYRDDA